MSETINIITLVASLGLLAALVARDSKPRGIVRVESDEKSI
jgi:hypothetical protein